MINILILIGFTIAASSFVALAVIAGNQRRKDPYMTSGQGKNPDKMTPEEYGEWTKKRGQQP